MGSKRGELKRSAVRVSQNHGKGFSNDEIHKSSYRLLYPCHGQCCNGAGKRTVQTGIRTVSNCINTSTSNADSAPSR